MRSHENNFYERLFSFMKIFFEIESFIILCFVYILWNAVFFYLLFERQEKIMETKTFILRWFTNFAAFIHKSLKTHFDIIPHFRKENLTLYIFLILFVNTNKEKIMFNSSLYFDSSKIFSLI